MKTPRQLLFDRHRSSQPKLDAIRHKVLASLTQAPQPAPETGWLGFRGSLRALLLSFRWHLAGMSAAWLLIALLNIDPASAPTPSIAKQNRPSPRQLLMALRENRRQLLEMIDPTAAVPSPAPPPLVPSRRSELQRATALA